MQGEVAETCFLNWLAGLLANVYNTHTDKVSCVGYLFLGYMLIYHICGGVGVYHNMQLGNKLRP